ncbi:MAG: exodeoxyribonuclease VII large subunit [Gammaproteobacteria bacterium]|nr:MAG: exodeoxyribonuclease VII large subunit [Gammaproteobacteria bacterium]
MPNPLFQPRANELASPAPAFSVSEINQMIADVLMGNLPATLSVEGEVSNLSVAASGHRYFSLKDSGSTISCALFRGSANRISRQILNQLKNGDKVVVKAQVSVYQPRGSYQLIVNDIEPAGFGDLAKAFAALKQQLDAAGYTANERKRPLPTWPKTLAVVTSSTGAAVQDVLTTLARRAPFIDVHVYPTLVQGNEAPEQIVQALQAANQDRQAAAILLVRGGGSLEDLQAFNNEAVAMAVVNSRLPVVTGVGHETDFTIVDFVSDARAPTPTAGAEMLSPDKQALAAALHKYRQRLVMSVGNAIAQRRQQGQYLANRLAVQHPQQRLAVQSQRLDECANRLSYVLKARLHNQRLQLEQRQRQLLAHSPKQKHWQAQQQLAMCQQRLQQQLQSRQQQCRQRLDLAQSRLLQFSARLHNQRQQLKGLEARLTLLSPLGILHRGYALVFDNDGRLLRQADATQNGQSLRIRLADGELAVRVEAKSDSCR